jgi:glycosyltransferase involved in cell wall biosynthesis
MKISVYTSVRNGIFFDFHVVEMLRHHVELADEIVVNEGYSDDGTYERIRDIDPKIRIYRNQWDRSQPGAWWRTFGDEARRLCTGDWCIKLDCDEFIPEWEFDRLRRLLVTTDKRILPMRFLNFYANYRVINYRIDPHWKFVIHRNQPDAEVVGDGANVSLKSEPWGELPEDAIVCHHFGAVRDRARLRQKWRNDGMMRRRVARFDWLPGFVYDLLPHSWLDSDFVNDLTVYDGPFVREVRNNPAEFTRDDMRVYEFLTKKQPIRPRSGASPPGAGR